MLITNDMLKGLDLNGVGLVINYELSFDKWDYYRRVSKTLRPYK
jgi:superfamily II DNA/RNA helicase